MRRALRSLPLVVVGFLACTGDDGNISSPPATQNPDGGAVVPGVDSGGVTNPPGDGADSGTTPIQPAEGCENKKVDATKGVFVESSGTDATNCGAQTDPCKTITKGLERAVALARSIVQVGSGTYVEQVIPVKGITIEGGWNVLGAEWEPICTDVSHAAVKIVAPPVKNVTVLADGIGGEATLRLLTIMSKAGADVAPGESIYGVFARGAVATKLKLDTVAITVEHGGAGAPGGVGSVGANGTSTCPAGDGATGGVGPVGEGAPIGTVDLNGYVPANGRTVGGVGFKGAGGSAGGAGLCSDGCVTACVFNGVGGSCQVDGNGRECGATGLSGCGGNGGLGGLVGAGGGSSFAVFTNEAEIDIVRSVLTPGAGGVGGDGGGGGGGGSGAGGARGADDNCANGCSGLTAGCAPIGGPVLSGGTAGGTGGKGGQGGQGGGGAGGWSYAIVDSSATPKTTTDDKTVLKLSQAGPGGGVGGAAGKAGTTWRPGS